MLKKKEKKEKKQKNKNKKKDHGNVSLLSFSLLFSLKQVPEIKYVAKGTDWSLSLRQVFPSTSIYRKKH